MILGTHHPPQVLTLNPNVLRRCGMCGAPPQIYVDMLSVYRMYSELISATIATGGPHAAKTSQVKLMRTVKKVRGRDAGLVLPTLKLLVVVGP